MYTPFLIGLNYWPLLQIDMQSNVFMTFLHIQSLCQDYILWANDIVVLTFWEIKSKTKSDWNWRFKHVATTYRTWISPLRFLRLAISCDMTEILLKRRKILETTRSDPKSDRLNLYATDMLSTSLWRVCISHFDGVRLILTIWYSLVSQIVKLWPFGKFIHSLELVNIEDCSISLTNRRQTVPKRVLDRLHQIITDTSFSFLRWQQSQFRNVHCVMCVQFQQN